MFLRKLSALVLVAGVLAACDTMPKKEREPGTIDAGSSVSLMVRDASAADATPRSEELHGRLMETLVSEGVFIQVLPSGSDADFNLVVLVGTVDEVTQGVGSGAGAAADVNKLAAGVALTDNSSNSVTKQFMVTAGSPSVSLNSTVGLSDAVNEAANKITYELKQVVVQPSGS